MKVCAIYNIWGDWDLCELSIKNILPVVDGVIVVFSAVSNFGEITIYPPDLGIGSLTKEIIFIHADPSAAMEPRASETAKRNLGLSMARQNGYTHFVMMDADEFYDHDEFKNDLARFHDPELVGLVCRSKVYFKSPDITIGYDTTLVPFIHKLTDGLKFEFNKGYPFAWTTQDGSPFTEKKAIRIDPTRSMNIFHGVQWSNTTMHHYSYVRADLHKKIRNSTAKQNLENSSIVADYCNAEPGYYCEFYRRTLAPCENLFNIPNIIDHGLINSRNIKKES